MAHQGTPPLAFQRWGRNSDHQTPSQASSGHRLARSKTPRWGCPAQALPSHSRRRAARSGSSPELQSLGRPEAARRCQLEFPGGKFQRVAAGRRCRVRPDRVAEAVPGQGPGALGLGAGDPEAARSRRRFRH